MPPGLPAWAGPMRIAWLRMVSRFQRRVRPAIMYAAVVRVLWILAGVAVAVEVGGDGGVRLAVSASFWRLFRRVTRRSRRTEGGGMLVGRTVGGETVVGDMKLRIGGVEVEGDVCEVGFGLGLDLGCEGAGAGGALGSSVKSSHSSNESSSHVGCGGAGLVDCWTSFAGFAGFAGSAGAVAGGCPSVNSPQSSKESSSHVDSGSALTACCAIPWLFSKP